MTISNFFTGLANDFGTDGKQLGPKETGKCGNEKSFELYSINRCLGVLHKYWYGGLK